MEGLDRRRSLAGVPMLHNDVAVRTAPNGVTRLHVRYERGKGLFEMFRPPVTERQYELDQFGVFVIDQVRQQHSVLAIVDAFQERYGLSRREAELGVVAFLKMLMKRGILSVVVK